jgi:hypothetical protein
MSPRGAVTVTSTATTAATPRSELQLRAARAPSGDGARRAFVLTAPLGTPLSAAPAPGPQRPARHPHAESLTLRCQPREARTQPHGFQWQSLSEPAGLCPPHAPERTPGPFVLDKSGTSSRQRRNPLSPMCLPFLTRSLLAMPQRSAPIPVSSLRYSVFRTARSTINGA